MKSFNHDNYKKLKDSVNNYGSETLTDLSEESIIKRYMYLPEVIAREFSLEEKAIGVLNIEDLIQEGMYLLCVAAKLVDKDKVPNDKTREAIIERYISDRIKGGIRRFIDTFKSMIRLPERKIKEIRNEDPENPISEDVKNIYFQNAMDDFTKSEVSNNKMLIDSESGMKEYNYSLVVSYISGILDSNLSKTESDIIKKRYGIGVVKVPIKQLALDMGMSEIKIRKIQKESEEKISDKIKKNVVLNYLFNN